MSTQDKIKALRAEADRLEGETDNKGAYDTLIKIGHLEYDVRKMLDFPDDLRPLCQAVEDAQRIMAKHLGHDERVKVLLACGMDEERAKNSDLVSDEAMESVLATWLFDRVGRHVQFSMDMTVVCIGMVKLANEHCPLGVKAWKEGRHDT